jgi:hypothetical protein
VLEVVACGEKYDCDFLLNFCGLAGMGAPVEGNSKTN